MKKIVALIMNFIFKFFPIKNNKIVFEAGRGLIDGNTKAIYNYIINNCPNEFEVVWLVSKGTDCSEVDSKHYFYYKTLKSYYHLSTAHYWIRSESIGNILKKKKGQIYIQLWHGNGAFKYIGYDISGEKNMPPLDFVKEWDYYIAKDELDASHIITSTGYNKKIEILGMAGMDTTINLSQNTKFKDQLLKRLNIDKLAKNKKIILYVPTFRDTQLKEDIVNVPIESLSKLKDSIILVRLHPLVRKKINCKIFENKNFINVCDYPDASDLLTITDVLITDYSSIFYQFAILNRPIVFYPYDFEFYKKLRGGFYLNYEKDLPGPICYKEQELFDTLKDIDNVYKKFKNKEKNFNKKYNYLSDGKSSERLVNKLIRGEFK